MFEIYFHFHNPGVLFSRNTRVSQSRKSEIFGWILLRIG